MGGGGRCGRVRTSKSIDIFVFLGWMHLAAQGNNTQIARVCVYMCVSVSLSSALSQSCFFFFIVSRAAHVSIYRIRSTVNAFIKPRERYASGNGRAMGARCVNATQWRRYIFCTVLYESHPWFLLTRGLMEYIKDIEIYIHILNTLTVYTYIHTHTKIELIKTISHSINSHEYVCIIQLKYDLLNCINKFI